MTAAPQALPARQRILIVEDEPFITLALEGMLPDLGFDVVGSAAQVSTALELIAREQIDCAILDVNLGLQRIDAVADALAARACPFIFTTGHSISGLPVRHANRAVLEKPFGFEQLETLLRAEFGAAAEGQPQTKTDPRLALADRPFGDRRLPDRRPAPRRAPDAPNVKPLKRGILGGGI
ncbi:MAG TPA: response regulator [Methylocella sp.]|nr:response regulator [Methylocella sp.]